MDLLWAQWDPSRAHPSGSASPKCGMQTFVMLKQSKGAGGKRFQLSYMLFYPAHCYVSYSRSGLQCLEDSAAPPPVSVPNLAWFEQRSAFPLCGALQWPKDLSRSIFLPDTFPSKCNLMLTVGFLRHNVLCFLPSTSCLCWLWTAITTIFNHLSHSAHNRQLNHRRWTWEFS